MAQKGKYSQEGLKQMLSQTRQSLLPNVGHMIIIGVATSRGVPTPAPYMKTHENTNICIFILLALFKPSLTRPLPLYLTLQTPSHPPRDTFPVTCPL